MPISALAVCTRLGFTLLTLLVCVPLPAVAQPAVVEGRVHDANGTDVSYANVRLAGTVVGAATDEEGRFRFTTQRRGAATLRASAVGYKSAEHAIRLRPGDTTTVHITLRAASVQLDEAVISGETYST
ncbi:MAG TPA: carboxypeptidase-like regulatory domain-containing protein, partial [Salinibacter sp.]|nr:carboxypeptidase-like regulatory domain-containing protein [Salinibacter sp.]